MTHDGVDKLVRDAVASHRRIRELTLRIEALETDNFILSEELDAARARIAELEHVERAAAELMARLSTMGTVIAHDDAARILAQVLKK